MSDSAPTQNQQPTPATSKSDSGSQVNLQSLPPPQSPPTNTPNRFNLKFIVTVVSVLAVVVGLIIGIILVGQSQELRQRAWQTDQSAETICLENGTIGILINFTNNQPLGADNSMDVIATDERTGIVLDLGTINPGNTQTQTMDSTQTSVTQNRVRFDLTWTNRSGTDVRFAEYQPHQGCQAATPPQPPVCTLVPETDDILVNFSSKRIRANDDQDTAQQQHTVEIPAGSYKITLSAYDNHSTKPDQTQTNEQYHLVFFNNDNIVTKSDSTNDIPEDQDLHTQIVNDNLEINQPIDKLIAFHSAYPSNNAQSLQPICALFTNTTPPPTEPTPTPTPTPAPTATPSPTPQPPVGGPNPTPTPTPTPTPIASQTPLPTTIAQANITATPLPQVQQATLPEAGNSTPTILILAIGVFAVMTGTLFFLVP